MKCNMFICDKKMKFYEQKNNKLSTNNNYKRTHEWKMNKNHLGLFRHKKIALHYIELVFKT